jgi:hypothetical protein
MPADPTLRASDADREQCADQLGKQLAAGRLTMSEFRDRVADAYAAVTVGDLHSLVADLPPEPSAAGHTGRLPSSSLGTSQITATRSGMGDSLRPWASWVISNTICLLVWAATSLAQGRLLEFWPAWVLFPWGAVLVVPGFANKGRLNRSGQHDIGVGRASQCARRT